MIRDLLRFINAQNGIYSGYPSYADALADFTNYGHKIGHWIWYIFPQLEHEFPGQSYNNRYFGIQGIEEATAYIKNEKLGKRLLEISSMVLKLESNDPNYVMGSHIDAKKLCSCMTLFSIVAPEQTVFCAVLNKYFGDKRCEWTLEKLKNKLTIQ